MGLSRGLLELFEVDEIFDLEGRVQKTSVRLTKCEASERESSL